MASYRAQCLCGAWPPPGKVEAATSSPTVDRGWVVVHHTCVCGRTTRFAHDTQGRLDQHDATKAAA